MPQQKSTKNPDITEQDIIQSHYILIEMKIEFPKSEEFVTDSFYEVEKMILDNFHVTEMSLYETELKGSKEIEKSIKNIFTKIMKSKKYDSCIKISISTQDE